MNTGMVPESGQDEAPTQPLVGPGRSTVAAIIPAAGRSERMGRPKLLVSIEGQTLIARVVNVLRTGGAERVLVVVPPVDSAEGPAVLAEAQRAGAEVIVPLERPSEMRESIELAIARLADTRPPRWVIITPADCPGITPQLVALLLDQAAREPEGLIIPAAEGRRGHPIVLPWELAAEIPRLPAGTGVNALMSAHSSRITELPVSSPDLGVDLDTPDDLRSWLDRKSPGSLSPDEGAISRSAATGNRAEQAMPSPRRIRLEVRLFAMARERAGGTTVEIELPLGARVADLRVAIGHRLPALTPLLPKTMIAVDEEYAADDQVLVAGSRVAVIPPVSGGSPHQAGGPVPNDAHRN
jgi:molybdenum cofactor cytidylyltransferase